MREKDFYTIGVDFGTLSARAVLANIRDGTVAASSAFDYPHGVITGCLPDSPIPLPPSAALADVSDYRLALKTVLRDAVLAGRAAGIRPEQIIALGLDATSSTFLPLGRDGFPLYEASLRPHPHAWMKLWKHHGAQAAADDLTRLARERREPFLLRTGGKINAEWMLPKLLEIFREDPEVWQATDRFMEIGDYLVMLLTGCRTAATGPLGYKMLFSAGEPSVTAEYLAAAEPGFETALEKIAGEKERRAPGDIAGFLTAEAAEELGLPAGIPVAAANIDAHVAYPTLGAVPEHSMLLILGTSCCTILPARESRPVEGVFGIVRDGVLPGLYGYESGQSAVGDVLSWFVNRLTPEAYAREAAASGKTLHELLTEKAAGLRPGESGLLALDWLNGNRSVLMDTELTGMILGLTLRTAPEEIYRALIEALVFGLREIIESYERAGVPVRELFGTGGVARKNALFLQILADVTGRRIRVARAAEGSALGSAIFAAACAGPDRGGYADIFAAARAMGGCGEQVYKPNEANREVYDALYQEYHRLHETFGRGENAVMKRLLALREHSLRKEKT